MNDDESGATHSATRDMTEYVTWVKTRGEIDAAIRSAAAYMTRNTAQDAIGSVIGAETEDAVWVMLHE